MSQPQEHWIKQIHHILDEAKKIPMWGALPSFPLNTFSKLLAEQLGVDAITIELSAPDWIDAGAIRSLYTNTSAIESIAIAPFAGQMFWLMSSKDQEILTKTLLSRTDIIGFAEESFTKGFYKYLLLQAMDCFEQSKSYPELHPELRESLEPSLESYCIMNIAIKIQDTTIFAKWAISSSMQQEITSHYAQKTSSITSHALSKDVALELRLQIATTTLSVSEWQSIKQGDCILLEHSSYDPISHKGSVSILLEDTPILRGRLKKNSVKIQDYAFYYEELQPMTDESIPPEKQEIQEESYTDDPLSETEEPLTDDTEHLWSESGPHKEQIEKLISSREIPIQLVVEVDRIRINLEHLLELRPGNVLELSIKPEQGVYLTVAGKKVAHGERIKLGDVLGLKILKIGV